MRLRIARLRVRRTMAISSGMDWYIVVKTINGRRYLYRQKTWRENGVVKTRSEYLCPDQARAEPQSSDDRVAALAGQTGDAACEPAS